MVVSRRLLIGSAPAIVGILVSVLSTSTPFMASAVATTGNAVAGKESFDLQQERSQGPCIYSVGTGKNNMSHFVKVLSEQLGVKTLVDVRAKPSSKANPNFDMTISDAFKAELNDNGIEYWHMPELGGVPGGGSAKFRKNALDPSRTQPKQKERGIFANLRKDEGQDALRKIMDQVQTSFVSRVHGKERRIYRPWGLSIGFFYPPLIFQIRLSFKKTN